MVAQFIGSRSGVEDPAFDGIFDTLDFTTGFRGQAIFHRTGVVDAEVIHEEGSVEAGIIVYFAAEFADEIKGLRSGNAVAAGALEAIMWTSHSGRDEESDEGGQDSQNHTSHRIWFSRSIDTWQSTRLEYNRLRVHKL